MRVETKRLLASGLVVALASGCATIKERRTVIDGPVRTRTEVSRSPDHPAQAQLIVDDGRLVLALAEAPQCVERVITTTEQQARTEREVEDDNHWYIGPLVGGILGGSLVAAGLAPASGQAGGGANEVQISPAVFLVLGSTILAAGGVHLGVELYNQRTTTEALPPKESIDTRPVACEAKPVVGADLTLTVNGSRVGAGSTDEAGRLVVAPDLLAARVQQVARGLRVSWSNQTQAVQVTEPALWLLATQTPAGAGYWAYLAAFPDGGHQRDAEQALDRLEADEKADDRRASADAARDQAEKVFAAGDLDGAWDAVTKAEGLGADVGALKARVAEARAAKGAEQIGQARALLKRGRLDDAAEALERATTLGVDDEQLRRAVVGARAQRDWKQVARSDDEDAIQAFINEYGDSPLAAAAQKRLTQVQEQARKEADFRRWFPAKDDGYEVESMELYFAVALNDRLALAPFVLPDTEERLKDKKGYAREQEEKKIAADPAVKAAMAQFRSKLSKATLYLAIDDPSLEYDRDYFLRTCEPNNAGRADQVTCSTFGHAEVQDAHQHLSASRSQRYSCYSIPVLRHVVCGLRLNGMPRPLKETLSGNGKDAIKVRWRWTGMSAPVVARREDLFGGDVFFRAPQGLAVEFMDATGKVLWSAR